MAGYERENIRRMDGYTPGEQPTSRDVVKLNTNENPYPPPDEVLDALKAIDGESLRRYPQPIAQAFREVAAGVHSLKPENIVAVNGGDELLRLAITTFVDPGKPVGMAEPGYGLYRTLPAIHDSPLFAVPLLDDWSLPDDFPERMNAAGARLVVLTSPHAPSGRLSTVEELSRVASRLDGVLLIDEAYVDFVDPEINHNTLSLIAKHDNVLILRTLSKGYSLAGLRFGYGLGAESLIEPIVAKTKDSYNVDVVAQRLAIAALQCRTKVAHRWEAVRAERRRMFKALEAHCLTCLPSQSNFLLASVPESKVGGARALYLALKDRNILVRYFDEDRLRDKVRITIGTPGQNAALIAALEDLLGCKAETRAT